MTIGFDEPFLSHHGVKGQKWGLRRYQNEDGSLTDEGKQRYGNSVFISGTTKTSEDGLYKRDKLPDKISKEIDKYITEGRKILVGDAPGIDSQVQDYLSGKNYKNVEVFVSGDEIRKMAGEKLDWTVNSINGENFEKYSKEWRAVKDKAMNSVASEGLAVVIKNGSGATRNNISRFIDAGKKVSVYQLDDENFVDPKSNRDEYEKMKHDDLIEKGSDFLAHYGVKGMQKGVRRWTNEDGTLTEAGKEHYGIGLDTGAKMNKKATSVYAKAQRAYAEGDYYSKLYGERAKKYDEKHDETEKEKYAKKYRTEITKGVEAAKQREMAERLLKQIEESANFDKVNSKDRVFNFYKTRGRQFLDKIPVIIPTPYFTYIGINNGVRRDAVLMTKDKTEDGYKHDVKTVFEWGSKKKQPKQEQKPEQNQAPKHVKFEDFEDGKLKMISVELKPGQTENDAVKEYYDKKKVKHDDLVANGEDFLSHHGITGQKWGQRRFQNEDGSLTPEGRIRYGLKPEYANLSDKEMNDAMSRKRYQNQYVDLMTAKSRKKKSDMDSLISEIGKFTNTGIDVVDKIGLQGFKDYNKQMQTDAENRNKAANRAKSVAGISAEERARIENEIAANNAEIARSKQALSDTKNAVEGFKKGVQATNETIAFKNKIIKDNAEIRRDREIAMRNIEEMDPDQLKKTVDRMLLEKQYDELLNPPKPSKVEKGKEILQTIGAVAGVALTVAQLIRLFKGKGDDTAKEGDEDGEYLAHYGVEGMKKGVRRWTYEDGSLTPEGYRHYGIDPNRVTARVVKTPEQKRKELKEQARQREFTKKLEARQALRDAKTQSQIQSVYDRQRLQTQYAEGKLGNKLAAENRANVRRNIIKGVVAVAATVSAMYVGRHILRESSLNNAHLREIDKINEESRMRINEAVAKADTIRLTDKDLVRLQNEDNADARRHAEEMGRQVNEATRNAHQQITGSQGAYLTSTKNVAENTTNKMEKLYRSSTSSRGLTAETGDAVRGRGRGARAVSYGGNALAINGTPEGGTPGDHAVGQRARAYERSSKHYKVSDESRKNGIDAMEKISRRYNIGATKVSKFALKGHNSIAARGLEALRLLALR